MPVPRIEPNTFHFGPDGVSFPNNPNLPVLVYHQVLTTGAHSIADCFEEVFMRNGWTGCWRWGVYDFQHFHCNAHEALGIAQGKAKLQLGGPQGEGFDVAAGDLVILPAGTAHKNLECSRDFLVVGAYPSGQGHYETNRGDPNEYAESVERIAATPLPETDPIFGKGGPLVRLWDES